jgi:hypothetical protein
MFRHRAIIRLDPAFGRKYIQGVAHKYIFSPKPRIQPDDGPVPKHVVVFLIYKIRVKSCVKTT